MRLRSIILLLTLLALVSITASGFYFLFSLGESETAVAKRRAALHTVTVKNQMEAFLLANLKPVRVLAELPDIRMALIDPEGENIERANLMLDRFQGAQQSDVVYLLDRTGEVVATSNRYAVDSFLGENYSIRPYYQQAMEGRPFNYLALGLTSKKRGAYTSYPIYSGDPEQPIGVVVIKASMEQMERDILGSSHEGVTLLAGPQGVIFGANRPDWLFASLKPLTPEEEEDISQSQQFGEGPWTWVGSRVLDSEQVSDRQGHRYLVHARELDTLPGWRVVHLQDMSLLGEGAYTPLIRTTGILVLTLCLLTVLSVAFLYRKAAGEIRRRTKVESELRLSEERYRGLYLHTPAMLHSIDHEGRLVSVSEHWCRALGYEREEVLGRKLTDFLTAESQRQSREENQPLFFRTGMLTDVPYGFVGKDGRVMDALLSAIAEKDLQGRIVRSLAVVMDVTQRKRAEEQLRQAQEKLSQYSKELERQVADRTREVMSFLAHTPAVIYMKDLQGRYLLVNSRFEALFGLSADQVRGRADREIFPHLLAEQFARNDQLALMSGSPRRCEEVIAQADGDHTYLSVKFPLQDEEGRTTALWSVSLDISEIKAAQESQRRLAGMILASQEKERSAIARELHDELGQVLTALRMDAVWLSRRLAEGDDKAAERARTMCDLIDRTITEVRSMATRLRPSVLDDLGLVDALEWHARDFESRTGVACRFTHQGVPQLKGAKAIAAYRVAQEALTNVARHAQARRVGVSLKAALGILTLSVKDDGRGFDPQTRAGQEGWGLAGMRERASLAGGRLEIVSAPGKGTAVTLSLPLSAEELEAA